MPVITLGPNTEIDFEGKLNQKELCHARLAARWNFFVLFRIAIIMNRFECSYKKAFLIHHRILKNTKKKTSPQQMN